MLLRPADWMESASDCWRLNWKFNIVELWKLKLATADDSRPLVLATVPCWSINTRATVGDCRRAARLSATVGDWSINQVLHHMSYSSVINVQLRLINMIYFLSSLLILFESINSFTEQVYTDSKVHGANMGSTWVLSAPDGPHVGPMNFAIRVVTVVCLTNISADEYTARTHFVFIATSVHLCQSLCVTIEC